MNKGSDDDEGPQYDEQALMNAMRSAAEMLAAEGLGNMVDIEAIQRQQKAVAKDLLKPQNYATEDDDEEEEEDQGSGFYSSSDGSPPPPQLVTQFQELSLPAPIRTRQHVAKSTTTYSEQAADGHASDFNTYGPIEDDDEDSSYENSDADSASEDDEHHMQTIQNAMRVSAGFGKIQHTTERRSRRRRGKRKAGRPRGRPRGKGKRRHGGQQSYSHEINQLLGTANRFYVEKELTQAFNMFCDIIRINPSCVPAWNTMALIREEQGKYDDALQLCTVAAHLNASDSTLWERLYSMHMDTAVQSEEAAAAGDAEAKKLYKEATDQALYCINHVVKNDPLDTDARARKIAILEKRNDKKAIIRAYKAMLHADPYNMESIRVASVIFAKQLDDIDTPIRWFTKAFAFYDCQAVELAEQAVAQKAKHSRRHRRRRQSTHPGADEGSDAMDTDHEGSLTDGSSSLSDEENGATAYSAEWIEYFSSNPTQTVPMEDMGGYSYNDLNMLAELRLLRREYEATIADIKRGARFVQGRGRDVAWAGQELDDQMDAEYLANPDVPSKGAEANELPIELRIKLGQCRLMLGHERSAEMHINHLFALSPVDYEDLYTDVADAYADIGHTQLAIQIYTMLVDYPETNQPSVWERLARCHRDAGDLGSARAFGQKVIDADPNDLDMRLWLGELYEEMGEVRLAYEMISTAEAIQRMEPASGTSGQSEAFSVRGAYRHRLYAAVTTRSSKEADSYPSAEALAAAGVYETQNGQPDAPAESLEPGVMQIKVRLPSEHTLQKRRFADDERKRCLAAMRSADVAFRKLDLLKQQIDQNTSDWVAIDEYCATAHRLYDDWRHMSAFYMADRSRPFRNYRMSVLGQLESSAKHGDIDMLSPLADGQAAVQRRLARMKKRLSNKQQRQQAAKDSVDSSAQHGSAGGDDDDGEDADGEDAVATTFRGQPFDRWIDMFLMYGKCLALGSEHSEALTMLDTVFQSNVFANHTLHRRTLKLMMTGIALLGGLDDQLYDLMRWWCGSKPTKGLIYKLFAYAMATSASTASSLTTSTVYRFVRRQLEHLDEMYYSRRTADDAESVLPMRSNQPVALGQSSSCAKDGGDAGLLVVATATTALRTDSIVTDDNTYSLTKSDVAALHSLAAHVMLVTRIGQTSIAQYTMALAMLPEDPSLALHLGVSYLVHATRVATPENKQADAIRGLVYIERYAELKYMQEMVDYTGKRSKKTEKSGDSLDVVVIQEIAYNYARAFHFLGLVDLAETYYKRVFELPVSLVAASDRDEARATCDLRSEAAYNLATIYALSGSLLKAKALLKEHCTID
ncbi:transcription factor TFIIIC subunit tfc4 [Coemansia sp. RSA 1813]|nr:transcription factor TFIIIC subunit tfc4 [Coemansia sp. RSA 1646]KAJ1767697.1 transcription factor TFIIIC subunit tfc4 [Coemansia sp. RSA 1843]KAJ2215542.1 transcription factor TFIIIC subunit tfc4 [Coemansia sp. RSA 487]KAJ2567195.1 transcription factor TFIIIC subunit tfc4 [Coemansia sp. RSA 1813]